MNNEFWAAYNALDQHVHMLMSGVGHIPPQEIKARYEHLKQLRTQLQTALLPESQKEILSLLALMLDSEYQSKLDLNTNPVNE